MVDAKRKDVFQAESTRTSSVIEIARALSGLKELS